MSGLTGSFYSPCSKTLIAWSRDGSEIMYSSMELTIYNHLEDRLFCVYIASLQDFFRPEEV